ncbi:ATP cone domain-containing protein [Hathewaya proteolytica DSM 3090]|uniref:ATP cone domain-containing protein n=1 Tax=Hathewaya proteolytica DSM 3090 TaxID=1121331 RepID=A0A1M6SGG9_9CLOT|nr:ATP cone domain-containing protein [Hathewaya proteolytica]SHK43832.1 ATP cone domain-containing protein [Hathewaya proteolytica DSM 3090]
MKIVKRSGKIVDFSMDKIKTSIETSACDINFSLTSSDINILMDDLSSLLINLRSEDGLTSSFEVRGLIYEVMMKHGFKDVCRSYMNL